MNKQNYEIFFKSPPGKIINVKGTPVRTPVSFICTEEEIEHYKMIAKDLAISDISISPYIPVERKVLQQIEADNIVNFTQQSSRMLEKLANEA